MREGEKEGGGDLEPVAEAAPGREDAPEDSEPILDALHRLGFIKSFGEGRRLIAQGGVAVNGIQVFDDKDRLPATAQTLRIGRREYELEPEGLPNPSSGEGSNPPSPVTSELTQPGESP